MNAWWTLCIAACGPLAHAGAALTDARFTSCARDACVEVRAAEAFEGTLQSGMFFKGAAITFRDPAGRRRTESFRADSLYYDVEANELQVRGMVPTKPGASGLGAVMATPGFGRPRDGFVDLADGQLHQLAN